MKIGFAVAAATLALTAAPAHAVTVIDGPEAGNPSCATASFSVSMLECAGGYDKNQVKSSLQDQTLTGAMLLGAPSSGAFVVKLESISGNTIDFGQIMTGMTIFAIHTGNGSNLGNSTNIFKFDAGAGISSIAFNDKGLSNAALLSTGGSVTPSVPEPATWALMLLGFGAIGGAMRARPVQSAGALAFR
jgi:hypothetical protein